MAGLRFSAILLGLAISAAPILEIGCASHPPLPDVTPGPYAGPPLGLDASGDDYVIVVRPPTPGWVITLDREAEQYRHQAIFVTLRRPNPAFLYPQLQVEQRIATPLPPTVAVKIYARVLPFDTPADDQPYEKASESPGRSKK
jgi:hypothetical protein